MIKIPDISEYSKLRNILGVDVLPPQEVTWELTDACNLKCEFCSVAANTTNSQMKELTYSEIKNVMNSMKNIGIKSIALSGGEPLVRDDIWDIIALGNEFGFDITLMTNGTLLSKNINRFLQCGGAHSVQISLHAPNPKYHDQIVGVHGSWKKVIEAITSLVEAKIPVILYTVLYS